VLGPLPSAGVGDTGPAGPGDSSSPDESQPPEASPSGIPQPILAVAKQAVPIEVDGNLLGTAAIMNWSYNPGNKAGDVPITVNVRYLANAPFDLGTGSWELLFDDGSTRPLAFADPNAPTSLAAGQSRTFKLTGRVPTDKGEPFIGYVDAESGNFVFVVAGR